MEDRPTPLDMERVARTNLDLSERLFDLGVNLTYDEDGDTLLVTIGQAQPAITVHLVGGIYVRVDPGTFKVMGFTIVGFASDLLANNKLIRKSFPNALKDLEDAGGEIEWKGLDAQRMSPVFEVALGYPS